MSGFILLYSVLLPCLITLFQSELITAMPVVDGKGVMKFLNRFGYISDREMRKGNMTMSNPVVQSSLKIFQEYAGVEPTGTMDSDTMAIMNKPRCGNKDMSVIRKMKNKMKATTRTKRYAIHSKWDTKKLTYQILNYPKCCINVSTVEFEIAKAFQLWMAEIPSAIFHVQKRAIGDSQKADIEIKFASDPHDEDDLGFGNMEGMAGRTLAHAFFPYQQDTADPIRGDIHFNNNENWTSGVAQGQNFLETATHEIGHALGLDHSIVKKAVMYFRLNFEADFRLHQDDKEGIKALYLDASGENNNPGIPTSRMLPRPTLQLPDVELPSAPNQTPTNHKRPGWHCQRLYNAFGNIIMKAEQCFGASNKITMG